MKVRRFCGLDSEWNRGAKVSGPLEHSFDLLSGKSLTGVRAADGDEEEERPENGIARSDGIGDGREVVERFTRYGRVDLQRQFKALCVADDPHREGVRTSNAAEGAVSVWRRAVKADGEAGEAGIS